MPLTTIFSLRPQSLLSCCSSFELVRDTCPSVVGCNVYSVSFIFKFYHTIPLPCPLSGLLHSMNVAITFAKYERKISHTNTRGRINNSPKTITFAHTLKHTHCQSLPTITCPTISHDVIATALVASISLPPQRRRIPIQLVREAFCVSLPDTMAHHGQRVPRGCYSRSRETVSLFWPTASARSSARSTPETDADRATTSSHSGVRRLRTISTSESAASAPKPVESSSSVTV